MQTEIKTTETVNLRVRETETGVQIDTWPVGAVGLDLKGIDQLVDTLQAQAARVRAKPSPEQQGLFDKVATR